MKNSKKKSNTGNKKKLVLKPLNKLKNKKKNTKNKPKKHIFLIAFLIFGIICGLACLSFCAYIIIKAPEFNVNELYKSSSSIIYDSEGNIIAELGTEKRDNVTYDELPEVLVDAIVATEDSKFFRHSGIDLLRFSKAVVGQLLGRSDAGGGSTLTMQIVKNTYNGTESHGINGIIRKFSDIYMAVFKLEKAYTKQQILEFYVNQPCMGGNIYGVEQASQSYFGKSVGELNIAEAATLAGLFQAPSAYNPYYYPELAEQRRNIVLSLMYRHKYITEEEMNIAKSVPLSDLLVHSSGYNASEYQGFLDTIAADVYKETGYDPYTTSMTIYSTMVKSKQDVINNLYNGSLYSWKNDVVQAGIAVTDVDTGALVAVGAGRNKTGAKTYNYATDINRAPGSTAKPIFDYGPAIEYEGWGTGSLVVDDKYTYSDGTKVYDVDRKYLGIMTIRQALAKSRNIPAIQAFQANKVENIYEFVTNLGITPQPGKSADGKSIEIYESSAIGAFNGTNPRELSAAYGAFARGGYYIEPYSFTSLTFNDTGETYTHTVTKVKAMSEETAYMINYILTYAVQSNNISAGSVSGTDIASKTGTSSIDSKTIKEKKLSSSAIMDAWQVAYSPDYVMALWYGYDKITKEYHLTESEGWGARQKITNILVKNLMPANSRFTKPAGVVAVDIELETNPVKLASPYTPTNLRSTEYYKKGTEPTEVSTRFSPLSNPRNLTYTTNGNTVTLSWSSVQTPDAIDSVYLQSYFQKGFKTWANEYYQNRLSYNANYIGTLEYRVYQKNGDTLTYLGSTPNNKFTAELKGSSNTYVVKASYTIFTANQSSGTEITVKNNGYVSETEEDDDNNDENVDNEKNHE